MSNVIKVDFSKKDKGSVYNKYTNRLFLRGGGVAETRIESVLESRYRFDRDQLDELLQEIKEYRGFIDDALTLKQLDRIGYKPNYFEFAEAAMKVSKKSKVHHYAHLILCQKELFHAYKRDKEQSRAELQQSDRIKRVNKSLNNINKLMNELKSIK